MTCRFFPAPKSIQHRSKWNWKKGNLACLAGKHNQFVVFQHHSLTEFAKKIITFPDWIEGPLEAIEVNFFQELLGLEYWRWWWRRRRSRKIEFHERHQFLLFFPPVLECMRWRNRYCQFLGSSLNEIGTIFLCLLFARKKILFLLHRLKT